MADRHGLKQVGKAKYYVQEVMMKILAEKTRYLANPEFNRQMETNPRLLMELFSK